MTPADLQPANFDKYPPLAQAFAIRHLGLLRELPMSVCPSFLVQIIALDTRFPVERETLEWQCVSLEAMEPQRRASLLTPLRVITLPPELERTNWVHSPGTFVEQMTASLWSSGQINAFHEASRALFEAIPEKTDTTDRLLFIVLGQGADVSRSSLMRKLARQGIRLEGIDAASVKAQMLAEVADRAKRTSAPYTHWYIDGGVAWDVPTSFDPVVSTSYAQLEPLRNQVLAQMKSILQSGQSGAEQMRTQLSEISAQSSGSSRVTTDPVLQRFYTELFTEGSGTQIFSTSFVQWAGRELARRAQPATVLLRYGPRQRHRGLNEMVEEPDSTTPDPEGSLVDAEMNAFYNWIAMKRITAPGRLTTLAWAEGSSRAVLISPGTKPNTISSRPLTISQALRAKYV
ncbi:hypothetical protein [Terriglobus roseus]|uniref:Uncharacterized protein n=1 Tax=Terriglobus roseus TaxID=392734 RepID=A0A1G7GUU7_9BACT|nr:hypothetical protein [Terriglobus roseus]SDE91958.1 hypothetical protein SAMN05444167_0813 [Terriglobus roseus]